MTPGEIDLLTQIRDQVKRIAEATELMSDFMQHGRPATATEKVVDKALKGSVHGKPCKWCREPITFKADGLDWIPMNLDGTRHRCAK